MTDGIKLAPCPGCNNGGWVDDGYGDWIRCMDCNPPPISAKLLEFARGARVRKPVQWPVEGPVDDLPPAA